jgi:hypothetical protein
MTGRRFNESHRIVYDLVSGAMKRCALSAEVFSNWCFMNAKTDAEAMFKKSKPALESRLDEEARRIENMSRLRNLRLARDKADRENDETD